MISLELHPEVDRKQRDKTGTTAEVAMGGCQGLLLSHTLFNVYMDTYLRWLTDHPSKLAEASEIEACNAAIFADDVRLQGKDKHTMQTLLTATTALATTHDIT